MHQDYLHYYRTLGLPPAATWPEVRACYRSLIKQWHPDRFTQQPQQRELAEEKTKELTRAFQALEQYYLRHGHAPLWTEPHAPEPVDAPAPFQANAAVTDTVATSVSRRRIVVGAALLGVVASMTYLASDSHGPKPMTQGAETPRDSASAEPAADVADARPRFAVGSTPGEVFAAQGIPNDIGSDVWHYGKSAIYFERGTVSHWREHTENPLRVTLPASSFEARSAFFTHGATKAEVREIQGNPSRETAHLWEYGASQIYFKADRVTSWHESPLYPLKVSK